MPTYADLLRTGFHTFDDCREQRGVSSIWPEVSNQLHHFCQWREVRFCAAIPEKKEIKNPTLFSRLSSVELQAHRYNLEPNFRIHDSVWKVWCFYSYRVPWHTLWKKRGKKECLLSHECDLTFQLIFAQNCTMFLIFPWHKKRLLACVSVCGLSIQSIVWNEATKWNKTHKAMSANISSEISVDNFFAFSSVCKEKENPSDQKKRWQASEIDPYSTNYISMNPKSLPSPVHNQTISQKSETRRTAIISQTTKSFISFPIPSDTYKNPFKTCTNYQEHNISHTYIKKSHFIHFRKLSNCALWTVCFMSIIDYHSFKSTPDTWQTDPQTFTNLQQTVQGGRWRVHTWQM